MRIFVAGASGVIGRRLVPLLVGAGHEVMGMTRTPSNLDGLRDLGAQPLLCDVFDADALNAAVTDFAAEAVIHQLTDLPDDPARIADMGAANSRMRRAGTRNLLTAARLAGASRFVAQSVAWPLPGDAGLSIAEHERAVLDAGGVVVRYGQFYGPGTYFEDRVPDPPRIHIDDAARRTLPALDAPSGVLVVAEDEEPHPPGSAAGGFSRHGIVEGEPGSLPWPQWWLRNWIRDRTRRRRARPAQPSEELGKPPPPRKEAGEHD